MTVDASVPSPLNPSELSALEMGTHMYRAAVIEELGVLLGSLGIDAATVNDALSRASSSSRELTLLDAKDLAEKLHGARKMLLGASATQWTLPGAQESVRVQVETGAMSAPDETTMPLVTGDDEGRVADTDEAENPEELEHRVAQSPSELLPAEPTPATETASETEPLNKEQLKRLRLLCGEEFEELLKQLDVSMLPSLVNTFVEFCTSRGIITRNYEALRKEQWLRKLTEGISWTSFGEAGASAQTTFSRSGIFLRQLPAADRHDLLLQVIDPIERPTNLQELAAMRRVTRYQDQNAHLIAAMVLGERAPADLDDLSFSARVRLIDGALSSIAARAKMTNHSKGQFDARVDLVIESIYKGYDLSFLSYSMGRSGVYAAQNIKALGAQYDSYVSVETGNTEATSIAIPPTSREVTSPDDAVSTAVQAATIEHMQDGDTYDRLIYMLKLQPDVKELLRSLFQVERTQPDHSVVARDIYDDLSVILDAIEKGKKHPTFVQSLEYRVLSQLVSGAGDRTPLAPKSVQARVANELRDRKRKLQEVIDTGIRQLIVIRSHVIS